MSTQFSVPVSVPDVARTTTAVKFGTFYAAACTVEHAKHKETSKYLPFSVFDTQHSFACLHSRHSLSQWWGVFYSSDVFQKMSVRVRMVGMHSRIRVPCDREVSGLPHHC